MCIYKEFTRSASQVRARVKFESRVKLESDFFKISFDCDSCFHNDVPVLNSKITKIIKQPGLTS